MLTRRHYTPRRKPNPLKRLHDTMTRMIELIVETGSSAKKGDEPGALERRLFEIYIQAMGFPSNALELRRMINRIQAAAALAVMPMLARLHRKAEEP